MTSKVKDALASASPDKVFGFALASVDSLDSLLGEVHEICDARGYITQSTLEVARVALALLGREETAEEYFGHMEITR